jgi:hypothetical protein
LIRGQSIFSVVGTHFILADVPKSSLLLMACVLFPLLEQKINIAFSTSQKYNNFSHYPHQHPPFTENIMFNTASNAAAKRLVSAVRSKTSIFSQQRPAITNRTLTAWSRADPEILQSGLTPLKMTATRRYLPLLGVTAAACAVGQYYYGDEQDFYDYRFICNADPDDLADFYGSENFMVCPSIKVRHTNAEVS